MPPPQALGLVAENWVHPGRSVDELFESTPSPGRRSNVHLAAAARASATEREPPAYTSAPIRPDQLVLWPSEDGCFEIHVSWYGRERILRAVVVRRLLSDAGYRAAVQNSLDGRDWQLTVSPVRADDMGDVIENFIW